MKLFVAFIALSVLYFVYHIVSWGLANAQLQEALTK
jgi:hypothetical protein